MYLDITLLCLAILPITLCYGNILEYMSADEVNHVFHTDVDSVPQYEVVNLNFLERLHKRNLPSGRRVHMRAFGRSINLWLHPRYSMLAGVNTPVWYAKYSQSAPEGVEFRRQHGLMEMIGQIFEDPNKMASLVIGTEYDGSTRVNGYIGSKGIAIRSLPRRVADEYRRRRRSVDNVEDGAKSSYHVLIKMDERLEGSHSVRPVNKTGIREVFTNSTTAIPFIVYPEILVVVEKTLYTAFNSSQGHDIYSLLEYLLAFWNGVDLKFRSLASPRFRLNIAGIVLSEDVYATPYIANHMVTWHGFNATLALYKSHSFYYSVKDTFPLNSYDAAVVLTRLEFGEEGNSVLGLGGVGSICISDEGSKRKESVTLVRDNGVFYGVHVTAHELGHLLGSSHDEQSENCQLVNGHIMTFTPWYTTNSSDFSMCSMAQFQAMFKYGYMTCLYNHPSDPGTKLPKLMPGRMKTLKEQCIAAGLVEPCHKPSINDSVCVNFYCLEDDGVSCKETGKAALDGTVCEGENKFCLHQQCVSL